MGLVRVWNENDYVFVDPDFQGTKVTVEPGNYIEMDEDDASKFLAKYSPVRKTADGHNFDPRCFKKLRIETLRQELADSADLINHATGKVHETEESLKAEVDSELSGGRVTQPKEKRDNGRRNPTKGSMAGNTL
jgi:hypothetical protein